MRFFHINHNTFYRRGAPWFFGAYARERILSECSTCSRCIVEPAETIRLTPDPEKGACWSDCIGCGNGFMGLYVSVRVKEILDREGIRYGKAFAAQVQEPYPKKLMDTIAPQYFHITGESGAEFDFEVSGCRIKLVCPACGRKKVDPASEPGKYQFVEGSWNGSHIFHTDLSSAMMFCTERILELARKHKWTNFRFVPLEECHEFGHKGIDYVH